MVKKRASACNLTTILKCQFNHHLVQRKQPTHWEKSSVLVQEEAREGAVLPGAAIDGTTMQPEPHLVSLEERQDGVVAGRLMIWGSIVGVRRHHHLFVSHEVNIEGHVDGELQDVEDEDIGSVDGAGEAADVGVVHFPQVTVQLVEHDGLVQVAWGEVGGARGVEGHSQRLGERVELHGEQGVMVTVGSERDLHRGDRQGIPVTRVHHCIRSLPVWGAHLGRVTPGC